MKTGFKNYKENYLLYLRKRGYGQHDGSFDLYFIKKAFIECWSKPGFHYFWRYWNPGIGFLTYRLFNYLGGNNKRFLAIMFTFLINGICHNIIVLPFLGWSFTLPITFLCFALFTIISDMLEQQLNQFSWHWSINSIANILLVLISFEIGFYGNHIIYAAF